MAEFETINLTHHDFKGQGDVLISELPDGDYLEHYQIKGAKHGIRRFQNFDGSLTPAGRERYGVGPARDSVKTEGTVDKSKSGSSKSKSKKSGSSLKKYAEKRKFEKAKKEEAKRIEDREGLKAYLRSHPKQLPKYSKALTKEEADEIISNIEFDRRLKDVRDAEVRRGLNKVQTVTNTMQTIGNFYTAGKNLYNSYVEINNALLDAGVIKGSRKTRLGDKPEDLTKKAHEKALDAYLRAHSSSDFYKERSKWSTEDAKKAKDYYNNLNALVNSNTGNKDKGQKDAAIQEIIDRLEDLENKYN